ncbi:hypothetical protein Barb4_00560 [Bacteroidales bacterium Barb4]|nr:hypothetical protein Barb4_00560 [Bacteroidales bacterium Barb4]
MLYFQIPLSCQLMETVTGLLHGPVCPLALSQRATKVRDSPAASESKEMT